MNDFGPNEEGLADAETQATRNSDFSPKWGENAPRGGKTVLTRVLKDGAKVPLFLGQTLDVNEIGSNKSNLIELPDPTLHDVLPSEVTDILCRSMDFPKNPQTSDNQEPRKQAWETERLCLTD